MKLNKKHYMIIAVLILLVFFLTQKPKIQTIKGEWDISEQVAERGYEKYLIEESDFDYTHPEVFALAQEIKSRTSTPEEAIKETLKYVVQNIRYTSITINYCYEEKASDALERGIGDCVSMARAVTALLRAQGIPTRTRGGCLSATKRCNILFATVPFLEAQVTPMVEGDFKKRGFLHEWAEIWTPDREWFIAEPTSGQTFPMSCYDVAYLPFSYDSNNINRCVINSPSFWSQCKVW